MTARTRDDFRTDLRAWPLIKIVGPTLPDKHFVRSTTRALEKALDRGECFCVLADMRKSRRAELEEVKAISEFAERHGDRLDAQVIALAIVAPSPVVRGAVKVLFALRKPQHPFALVETMSEANSYLEPFLAELEQGPERQTQPFWIIADAS